MSSTHNSSECLAPVVFMFSGQGSHYYQMAAPLYRHNARFRHHIDLLDAHAVECMGASVIDHIHQRGTSRDVPFTSTHFSHPGIYMIECALANTLADAGVEAEILMGSSMGTFVAAAIGGCLSHTDALSVVVEQARLIELHCSPGAMLAVLASPTLFDQSPQLHLHTELAGINMPKHFVISGQPEDIDRARLYLAGQNVVSQQLNVSYAFHSKHIRGLRGPFLNALQGLQMRPSRLPIVCSAQARKAYGLSYEDLWNIAVEPIRFRDSVAILEATGPCHYIDLGPSGTLATFVKYCLPADSRSTIHTILTPFGDEIRNLDAVVERFAHRTAADHQQGT